MATTNFTPGTIVTAEWLNDTDALTYGLPTSSGSSLVGYGESTVESALDAVLTTATQKLHHRRVYAALPLVFPDYMSILTAAGYTNDTGFIYPGSFAVDETAREIFVICGPSWTDSSIIVVYNLDTLAYKGYFRCVRSVCEGGEITYDIGGTRKFWMADYQLGNLYEYDIATTTLDGSTLTEAAVHAVGVYNQFSYRKGVWMVEEGVPDVGQYISRNVHALYDADFVRIGTYYTDIQNSGYVTKTTNDLAPYLNKRQGFALGDGFVVCAYGGSHDGITGEGDVIEYQGTRILSPEGRRMQESLLEPVRMKAILSEGLGLGETYYRMENEGVKVLADGSIIALYVHKTRLGSGAVGNTENGIILMREYDASADAIDFSAAAVTTPQRDTAALAVGKFPRSSGGMFNPLTGEQLTTMEEICDYLLLSQQKMLSFYSSDFTITDVDGQEFPSGCYVTVTNANGLSFFVNITSGASKPTVSYSLIGASGSRVKNGVYVSGTNVRLSGSYGNEVQKLSRIFGAHYTESEEDFLAIDIQSNPTSNNLMLGGGSGSYNAATTIRMFTSADGTTLAGTERLRIEGSGPVRPGADNAQTLGSASFRWSQLYAGTTTIATSDEQTKRLRGAAGEIDPAALRAVRKVKLVQFQFNDAIEEKGDGARWHFGVIAQQVKEAFESEGLDPFAYGLLCYDQWDDEYEPVTAVRIVGKGEDGRDIVEEYETGEMRLVNPAGSRYGVRYEELLCLKLAAMEAACSG